MSASLDIDKIDDILEMANTMATLKISSKGLKTLDQMKAKVKETLQSSEKKSSWTAKEAFSVLTEAKKEDEKKRATLLNFYEHMDVCLQSMDEKVHALLEQNIGNLKEKIASHKQNLLEKEYIVLVAGETSSGKSTLLNLILGEQLLPYSLLSTTSTICELRYGDTPKLVAHFKDKGSGDTSKTVLLNKPSEASEQSYLQQISEFVHLKTNREKGSDYEKIELFWPHNLLKENVVIVDSPGIGESTIMNDIVKEYLPEAFAFIYVINSENAGGIQRDRVKRLIEHARQVSIDKQRESSSNCALFVCNKWDQVPPVETDEVKNHILTKLTQCWPSLDPESQIIFMSARDASEAQKLGVVTEEFTKLMNGIKSMVLKSIEERLQIQWRWLDYLLARMALHTKAFIRNSSEDRKDVIDRMMFITNRLQSIERQKGATSSEFHSISSTSESPPNQEELKKWKQKTKIVETDKLKDIDKFDVITGMVTTMASLKISSKGLTTLDEMKAKVKETLQSSQKESHWKAKEAFSVLTEAKKEDERKRATLLNFYEHTDICLQSMDEKVHALLEQDIGNLKEKIASYKQNLLKKEYIVLVAGETYSGKSTLLNLILGEQLLPYSVLSTTSTICELRYGDTPMLVAHFKDKGSGDTSRTVLLDKPTEASEQSYLQQISEFVHLKTNREKGSDYEKIELFWPHNLLKENVVIVDSPGIGESTIMDDIVKEYLPEAFTFIYVINSENAGGVQRDRVERLIEHARQVSIDKQRESSSNCALFVCNKWDQVPSVETDEVKNHIVTKLTQCWPSLDPESQIIYMSARDASEAQKLGVVTEEFAKLMNGIKSMVLKSIEERLQIQWRWLDYLLARMALHTKAFIRNSSEDRKDVIDRMMFITNRLQSIERQKGATSSEFHSISSTSESPPNQEELKKWKQKTKIVETDKLKDIDKFDVITGMVTTMASLKISSKGLTTLDEMKAKVKETLQSSQKESHWKAKEAFSVLTEAKKEDERKRATLLNFYEHTDICLQSMDEKVHALLEQDIGNLKEKIASHKQNLLKEEYIVLVAGETSSGKSTLLNLILGEQLLPYTVLSTTSTICELRYGDTPKLVVHFKDKGSGDTSWTVPLKKPTEGSKQSYLQQISQFVHRKTYREKGSDYKKIELFWPHDLLKENIVMVDSPGICESTIMDDIVKEYLPEAFAFIYVINSENAGGIQPDRLKKLIEHARRVSLDKQRESSSKWALFVCNKWDHMPSEETEDVKNHIVTKLTECWPFLDPESQIIYMSAKQAIEAQNLGVVTLEFAELMNGIKSMVLKSIEARLQIQWRWLDYLLARMALHTKAFIRTSSEDRMKVIDRMKFVTDRLQSIEREQGTVRKQLQLHLQKMTDKAVSALSTYLKSSEVMQQFSSWTLDEVPKTKVSWEITQNYIQNALRRRLQEKIEEWEEKNHVFSDARASLIQNFQERFRYVEGQLRTLEGSVLAGGVPVLGAIAFKGKLENWNKTRQYNKDKCAFMAKASQEYLNEVVEEQHLRPLVIEQLKEARVCLKQVLDRIPQLIEEDKMLCQQLSNENRSKKEVEDFYTPLLEKSVQIRDVMALFGIKEVRTMDISCDDLEWQDDAPLGSGAFASVYRGKLRIRGENKPLDVAVKVWNEELDEVTAGGFISETEILRKLNCPFIVKFYGAALRKEGEQLKAILVMELCKENLMRHIFRHERNIPGRSSTVTAAKVVIGWAKDIANALKYIHRQGIVHRDLKLENILLSQENIAKLADVGVSKEAKAITGTMTGTPLYLAPEVIKSHLYDYKADIYSFGIMLWEMWYGSRPLLDVEGNVYEYFEKVVEGVRPTHVEGSKEPPAGLRDLMQRCWDEKPDNRPDASECYEKLFQLYRESAAPSS